MAQADTTAATTTDDGLDEVVVVANRAPEALSKVGSSVTVIDAAAIQESQSAGIADLLVRTPGITLARNGGVGQPTSVFIRGAESDQTVVLIDGVQLNDPASTGGGFDFQNLMTGDFSRVEILRGAQSTLYGSQAIGGVVNITTAEPTSAFGGGIDVEGGSLATGSFVGDIGGRTDTLQWRLSGNWYRTDGISAFDERLGGAERDSSHIGGGSGTLRYDITPDLQLDLRGYYTEARTDFDGYQPPLYTLGDDSEYGRTDQALGYAGLTLRSPDRTLTNRVAFQYTNSETRNYDPAAPANGAPSTETFYGNGRNEREEYEGTWQFLPGYQAVYGAQHERSTIKTDTPSSDFDGPAPLENYATIDSGYLQLQGDVVRGLTLTAGERYDHHDVYGGHSTGQVAAAWLLNDNGTLLRSSFSQGFKAPSLYQLYSQYGDRSLQPEQAHGWDAGVEQHLGDRALLSATYFRRDSRNLIAFFDCSTPSPLCLSEPFGYYANIARAEAHGVEVQSTFKATAALDLSANYTYTDTEDKSSGSATYDNELPRRPKQAANMLASYRWPIRLSTDVAVRYGGRSFDDAANAIALGGYVLVDLRVSYPLSEGLDIYARVENVGGKSYETAYQYGSLGRVAYAGVRARF